MVKCNLCDSQSYKTLYPKSHNRDLQHPAQYTITQDTTRQSDDIVRCLDCGLTYTLYSRDKSSVIKDYSDMEDGLYLQEEHGRRRAAKRVLKELSALKNPGRLLEIGSATGFFLDEAKKAGWKVIGIEPSKWATEYAQTNFELDIIESTAEEADLGAQKFDVIVLIDVIEHFADPKYALEKIRRLLNADGILYIATPDIDSFTSRVLKRRWWGIKSYHLYYFNRKLLKALLDRAGFEIVKRSFYSRYFSIGYITQLISKHEGVLGKALARIFDRTSLDKKEIPVNFYDQIALFARKKKLMNDIVDSSRPRSDSAQRLKTTIVLPAYNAAKTLRRTVSDMPEGIADEIILVDDKSSDATVAIARDLGLTVFTHDKNSGYGGNQKTCYEESLRRGADIVVMLHPDYQYDPKMIPELIEPIRSGRADAVFGSRMMKGGALDGGMPKWKHNANILLTALENVVLGTYLTEYHSGFRAYSRELLKSLNFKYNSDGFIFDTEIIVQILLKRFKIEEIPIHTRYFKEASTIGFLGSCLYGLGILKTLFKYLLHIKGLIRFKQFS